MVLCDSHLSSRLPSFVYSLPTQALQWRHNERMAPQITGVSVLCWTVASVADQRKHRSSASFAFMRRINRWPGISRKNGQQRGKCFHLMTWSWGFQHNGHAMMRLTHGPAMGPSALLWMMFWLMITTPAEYPNGGYQHVIRNFHSNKTILYS